MQNSERALKLLLDGLGLPAAISTVRDRKTVQKSIYLVQASGVDLGYRYNWYRMGPYAPSLTRDYFGLAESLAAGDDDSSQYELQSSVRSRVDTVRGLLEVPAGVSLDQADWLELLASVHYLMVERGMPPEVMLEQIEKQKQHVAPFTATALSMLQDVGLIPVT